MITPEECRLFLGDVRGGLKEEIASETVNLLLIDPPYTYKDYPDLWEPMAQTAERILVDKGIALIMAGTANLDIKMEAFSKYLRYHWCLSVLVERASPALQWMSVAPRWKPVLVFVKGS